jgi:hypothetical protein
MSQSIFARVEEQMRREREEVLGRIARMTDVDLPRVEQTYDEAARREAAAWAKLERTGRHSDYEAWQATNEAVLAADIARQGVYANQRRLRTQADALASTAVLRVRVAEAERKAGVGDTIGGTE